MSKSLILVRRDVAHVLLDLPERIVIGPTEAKAMGMETGFAIHRGVPGYTPVPSLTDSMVKDFNAGVTEAQKEAMLTGSAFGWHVPGADPLNCERRRP